jgi:hypothetical protein
LWKKGREKGSVQIDQNDQFETMRATEKETDKEGEETKWPTQWDQMNKMMMMMTSDRSEAVLQLSGATHQDDLKVTTKRRQESRC